MHLEDVLPPDAIPSIDDPVFDTTYFGPPDDEVIVVDATPPRAYPIRILSYHEIVNDVCSLGERDRTEEPVAVTWCPICASAVGYSRTVDDRVLTFGTSGKLADDALVMYDRETGSEWKQPLGTAISGPLEGTDLTVVPTSIRTWEAFTSTHPDGVVLQPVHGGPDDPRGRAPEDVYEMAGYDRYDAAEGFGLREMRGEGRHRTWDRADIEAKTPVIGIVREDDAVGYPLPVVEEMGGVLTDDVGGSSLLVAAVSGRLYAYADPGYGFERRDGTVHGDGTTWDLSTGRASDGRRLTRVPARRLYAFAWQDDHGSDSFYGLESDSA